MAHLSSNELHLPKHLDFKDRISSFWREESTSVSPLKHTMQPIVTGTSVLGIKTKHGVVIAADTLGSYGSLARFRDIKRFVLGYIFVKLHYIL